MSHENVNIIRRMLDQGQQRREALWDILDDEVQWEAGDLGIAGLTTFHGPDGVSEVWTLRDGKVIHSAHYWEKVEALQAAGLSE